MFRSLLRMLKHISLAVIAIIATVCIAEVGLRAHHLYQRCEGTATGACPLTPAPCPVAYQQMPPLLNTTRRSCSGEEIIVRTNSLGLRGGELAIPKSDDVFRIVCLGDDATFAVGVDEPQTFTALVEATLAEQSNKPIEVVNAGMPGYCPLLSLAWARQRLAALQPDLIILCCDRSDVADDARVRPLAKFDKNGWLESVCHPATTRGSDNLVQALEQEFTLAAIVSEQLASFVGRESPPDDLPAGWEAASTTKVSSDPIRIRQTWEPIDGLRKLSERLSADFVVALIPSPKAAASPAQDQPIQLLSAASEEYGVPYLNVTSEFAMQTSPRLFEVADGSLTPAGHRLFADLLGWAIIHRDPGAGSAESLPPAVMPTAGMAPVHEIASTPEVAAPEHEPQVVPANTLNANPLPTPTRRPRQDETPDWAR